jgi:branched-chain amino acid transport system substrate-binding protein
MTTRLAKFCVFAALLATTLGLARAQGDPVVVGAVLTQTGLLADLAADLRKALLLWQEEVNATGGLLGRRVELRLLDDRSDANSVRGLYEQLIRDERADLLVGPFGSAATLGAAGAAELHRRVLLNVSGAARATQRAGLRYVFQVPAPFGAYAASALELAVRMNYRRIVIVARNDPVAREMAEAAQTEASALGLQAVPLELHTPGADDLGAIVARARAAGAEAWIAFGLPRDAVEMVKTFRKLGYAPAMFVAQGAADPQFVVRLGQDAEQAIGITPWERSWRTPGNAQFAASYLRKWSMEPTVLAAQGYAAGRLIEAAVRRAGSLDQEVLRDAFAELRTETPLGAYAVDRSGAQRAVRPALVQIQRGRRETIWPESLATARWQLPYPRWEERRVLK